MKLFETLVIFLTCTLPVFSDQTNVPVDLKINTFVELPGGVKAASGFLKYTGAHNGITVCALSMDIGSAVPSEDFRLYAKIGDNYRLMLAVPMLLRKGFRCTCEADTLTVYLTREYEKDNATETNNPVLFINLRRLIEGYAEPSNPPLSSLRETRHSKR